MRDAFALLASEFTDDEQWGRFIFSAWVARADYGVYRDKLKRAAELKDEIAETATNLSRLLTAFYDTGVLGPDEFSSVADLLRKTDNHDMRDHNLHMWRTFRSRLLGDLPRGNAVDSDPAGPKIASGASDAPPISVSFVQPGDKLEVDHEQQARDMARYIWQLSPDVPALLETLATAAREFKPSESGMVAAAIISRQRNVKTEYLRAFADRLTDSGLGLTTAVMRAMAVTASVAINLPDVDVSYDDVRKALARLGGEPPENSGSI